jgi:hypothetical protein
MYVITADYPPQARHLQLEIFLNLGDIYTDWKFHVEHSDYYLYAL